MAVLDVRAFGQTLEGEHAQLFTLRNRAGLELAVSNYGATIVSLVVPNRVDVVLGFERLSDYLADVHYLGATIGRYANRIDNGRFALDGKPYRLSINDAPHSLHGGIRGFDKRLWTAVQPDPGKPEITFRLQSRDGDQGYPGSLQVTVTFALGTGTEFQIIYGAVTDKPTIVNFTNHSYFNLAGAGTRTILNHVLQVNAGFYTPLRPSQVPRGEIREVAGTVVDFRMPAAIGSRMGIKEPDANPIRYNENYVLDGKRVGGRRVAAVLLDPETGRSLTVSTDQPGIQVYTGNYLNVRSGKRGIPYAPFSGICLEPQHFPNSPNCPHFPSTVLRPGTRFHSVTEYRFSGG